MSRPDLTLQAALRIAHSAGTDAANRSARRGGRSAWSDTDRDAAQRATETALRGLGFGQFVTSEVA
jgi:hypothetical protein